MELPTSCAEPIEELKHACNDRSSGDLKSGFPSRSRRGQSAANARRPGRPAGADKRSGRRRRRDSGLQRAFEFDDAGGSRIRLAEDPKRLGGRKRRTELLRQLLQRVRQRTGQPRDGLAAPGGMADHSGRSPEAPSRRRRSGFRAAVRSPAGGRQGGDQGLRAPEARERRPGRDGYVRGHDLPDRAPRGDPHQRRGSHGEGISRRGTIPQFLLLAGRAGHRRDLGAGEGETGPQESPGKREPVVGVVQRGGDQEAGASHHGGGSCPDQEAAVGVGRRARRSGIRRETCRQVRRQVPGRRRLSFACGSDLLGRALA